MNIGLRHAIHLTVAVYSLRQWWDGPVKIMTGDAAALDHAKRLQADKRLDVEVGSFTYDRVSKRGSFYYAKCLMNQWTQEWDRTVFLDADTLVVNDFREVFPTPGQIRLTAFADWKTNSGKIRRRLEPYREILPGEVALMSAHPYPALNTGVIGFTRETEPFFKEWMEKTRKMVRFMCDELVAQCIFYRYPHLIMDERWNCSPIFSIKRHHPDSPLVINDFDERMAPDPRIWHGHGFKFMKRPTGREIWMPYYEAVMEQNIGGIRDWERGMPKRPQNYLDQGI